MMNEVHTVRDLMYQLAEEYLEATDRLQALNAEA